MEQAIDQDEIRRQREQNQLEAEGYKMDIGFLLYQEHCKKNLVED